MVDSEPVCLPVPQQKKPKLLKHKSDMLKLAATATHNEENSEHIHCSLYFCSSVTSMIKSGDSSGKIVGLAQTDMGV